jgi:paraquat-inducible protein B
MSRKANPTLIGAFVLGALILAIIAVLLLAGDEWVRERQQHVLYFDEAGQGLQVGAPVVFLGVRVGTVKHIQIGLEEKGQHFKVQVTIELDLQMINTTSGRQIAPEDRLTIRQLVEKGMRARLKMQSLLTGQLYVDLAFYPGKPAKFVNGDEDINEIPTIPTTVEELASLLEDFPMSRFLADLASIGASTSRLLASSATQNLPDRLDATLKNLESLSATLDARGEPLLQEVETVLAEIHKAIEALSSAMVKIGGTADRIGKLADAGSPVFNKIEEAGSNLAEASRTVQLLADEESPTIQQLTASLQEMSRAARSLRLLAESLEQQPEAVLRGKRDEEVQP